ncbi:MAG TPA: hypothetical protein VN908_04420 [Gemmatimonadales bacterium]|nr:hypothetical protein [Gemmatimonadales bacterium]
MTRRSPPYEKGDPRAKEYGKLGGRLSAEAERAKAAADPETRGLLGHLLTYTTSDWMDRLGLTGPSWAAWRIVGKVLDNLPLNAVELETYRQLTGRTALPTDLRELWAIAGRGSGKSTFMAVQAVRAACRGYQVRGIARVLLLAFVKEQAGIAFEYVSEFFDKDSELRRLVTDRRRGTHLELAHGVRIQTIASNYRQVRGYSVAAALLDEVAHWWNEVTNANPDVEVVRALRPGLGKVPGSRLLAATTPWTQEGLVYDIHERHYAQDASQNILVVKAATLTLNPSFDATTVALAEVEDPESAAAEYGAAWRVAGGSLVRPEVLDAAIDKGITERAPEEPTGDAYYGAAVDLSGGTGQDSAALSIQHVEQDDGGPEVCFQDVLREWLPPFDPAVMVTEVARECQRFGITEVVGDAFSEGFAGSEFRRHGITYTVAERKTAECLLDSLAVLNTHRVRLLDDSKARRQWLNLRRDYASGGRPTVVDRPGKHDDLAVVTARGIVACLGLGEEPVVKRKVVAMFGPIIGL